LRILMAAVMGYRDEIGPFWDDIGPFCGEIGPFSDELGPFCGDFSIPRRLSLLFEGQVAKVR